MARKSRNTFAKRQRERLKAEKAADKRARREERSRAAESPSDQPVIDPQSALQDGMKEEGVAGDD